jgi:hypothetical protein
MNPEIILLTLLTTSIIGVVLITCLVLYLDVSAVKKTNMELKTQIKELYNQIDVNNKNYSDALTQMYKRINNKAKTNIL